MYTIWHSIAHNQLLTAQTSSHSMWLRMVAKLIDLPVMDVHGKSEELVAWKFFPSLEGTFFLTRSGLFMAKHRLS